MSKKSEHKRDLKRVRIREISKKSEHERDV